MIKQLLLLLVLPIVFLPAKEKEEAPKLRFVEGGNYHVRVDESLRLVQQFSQVDSVLVDPSTRFTTYHFTENIDKVFADGSALISATLDSVSTKIYVGIVADRNEYFRFNSNNDFDIGNRLKDIRALPRAQLLGQTLKYVLSADGRIHHFENLSNFQSGIIARSYDYDMLHALLAFTDSLRLGQILEQGAGALTATAAGGKATVPYALTEIHLDNEIQTTYKAQVVTFKGEFKNAPTKINYLEGIAFPIAITNLKGGTKGTLSIENGRLSTLSLTDSATMDLSAEGEIIHSSIHRTVSVLRKENEGIRGSHTINVKELRQFKPEKKPEDSMVSIPLTPPRRRN